MYPLNDEMRNHKQIEFSSGAETKVGVHFVDVAKIEESLKGLVGKLDGTIDMES